MQYEIEPPYPYMEFIKQKNAVCCAGAGEGRVGSGIVERSVRPVAAPAICLNNHHIKNQGD